MPVVASLEKPKANETSERGVKKVERSESSKKSKADFGGTLFRELDNNNTTTTIPTTNYTINSQNEDRYKVALETLTHHKWYHGMMPRAEIEELLTKDGDFLVRKTEVRNATRIAISVYFAKRVRHILINQKVTGEWYIREMSKPTIIELIQAHIDQREQIQPGGTIIIHGVPRPDYYILHDNIDVRERLGGGNFGDVHRGVLTLESGQTVDVAVKKLKGEAGKRGRTEFVKEAKLARRFHNQNIVQMLGVAPQEEPILIVLELCKGGSLQGHLKRRADLTTNDELVKYATDACRGMCYLASRKVIHRDLAARNCLLSENNDVKISDFGLASTETVIKVDRLKHMPVRWLSPETLNRGEFTTKTDVWSFGVLTWEIANRCRVEPFPNMTNAQARQKIQSGTMPLETPDGTPTKLQMIMSLCFVQNPEERPGFELLLSFLSPAERMP